MAIRPNGSSEPIELKVPIPDARAIRDCLNYLQREAAQANLSVAAYLIGAAALSIEDDLKKHERRSDILFARLRMTEH